MYTKGEYEQVFLHKIASTFFYKYFLKYCSYKLYSSIVAGVGCIYVEETRHERHVTCIWPTIISEKNWSNIPKCLTWHCSRKINKTLWIFAVGV